MTDVVLYADGYTGRSATRLGVFELQEEVVQGRPTYKKRDEEQYLFYRFVGTVGCWMVGEDTSKPSAWWLVKSGAETPDAIAITEVWMVHTGSVWSHVGAVTILPLDVFTARALEAAVAYGPIVLHGDDYTGQHAEKLGIFDLQEADVVQGRPTYKMRGAEVFLYYDTYCSWSMGPDMSRRSGWWMAVSSAMTPVDITETWQVGNSDGAWVDVDAVTVSTLDTFKEVTMAVAQAEGDIVLHAPEYVGSMIGYLGVYTLQPDTWKQGRPTYKKEGVDESWPQHLLYYGPYNAGLNWSGWQVGNDLDSEKAAWVSKISIAKTPMGIAAPSPPSTVAAIEAQDAAVKRAETAVGSARSARSAAVGAAAAAAAARKVSIAQKVLAAQLKKLKALKVKLWEYQWKVVKGPVVFEVETLLRTEFEAAARAAAALFGDVALRAVRWVYAKPNPGEVFTETMLGVFALMDDLRNGRPMYKRPEKAEYLYYSEIGEWRVGTHPGVGRTLHWWYVTSSAMTPDKIVEEWRCYEKVPKTWEEVAEAEIVKAAVFTKAVIRRSSITAHVTIPGNDTVLLFDRQEEVVHGRPTYHSKKTLERLYYTVEQQQDDAEGLPVYTNYWALGDHLRVKSFALTPFDITDAKWEFGGASTGWQVAALPVKIKESVAGARHDGGGGGALAAAAAEAPDTTVNWVAALRQIVLSDPFVKRPPDGWDKGQVTAPLVVYERTTSAPKIHFTLHAADHVRDLPPASHFRRDTAGDLDVPGKILALLLPWTVRGETKAFPLYWVKKSKEDVLGWSDIIGYSWYVPHDKAASTSIEADDDEQDTILKFVRAIATASRSPVNRGALSQSTLDAISGMLHLRTPLPGLKF